jgi:hypothetical protein
MWKLKNIDVLAEMNILCCCIWKKVLKLTYPLLTTYTPKIVTSPTTVQIILNFTKHKEYDALYYCLGKVSYVHKLITSTMDSSGYKIMKYTSLWQDILLSRICGDYIRRVLD